MRAPSILALLLASVVAGACASSRLHGDVWVDDSYDFAGHRTFYMSDYKSPPPGTPASERRALAEKLVAAELEKRGFRRADRQSADLEVDVLVAAQKKARTSGSSTWGDVGGIDVAILDSKTGRSVWRGWVAESWYASSNPDEEIPKAIDFLSTQLAKPQR